MKANVKVGLSFLFLNLIELTKNKKRKKILQNENKLQNAIGLRHIFATDYCTFQMFTMPLKTLHNIEDFLRPGRREDRELMYGVKELT